MDSLYHMAAEMWLVFAGVRLKKASLQCSFCPNSKRNVVQPRMKLLVFASVPPPHHGQSYMVQLMLDGFGGDRRRLKPGMENRFGIECYHVDARFSQGVEDIGKFQGLKLARL